MAIEGVELGIEIDSSYRSVAASWFGSSDDSVKPDEVSTPIKKKKKKEKPEQAESEPDVLTLQNAKEPDKTNTNLSSFLDVKLTKKLKKSKKKAEKKQKDEDTNNPGKKKDSEDDNEEDSKTAAIKTKSKASQDAVPPHSMESLKKRLESDTLSHSTRKRLKKRLNKLIRESSGTDGETSVKNNSSQKLSTKPSNASLTSTSSTSENGQKTEMSPLKRKLEEDAQEKEQESPPSKKKRKKKRSKQKNIKKDHRPDHLKPAHLRSSPSEAKTDTSTSPA